MNKDIQTDGSYIVVLLITAVFLFGAYKSYEIQKDTYRSNIALRLQGACYSLIKNDFAQHVSSFDISDKDEAGFGIKSNFTFYNDLIFLTVSGKSELYFENAAPQEIDCMALYSQNGQGIKITRDTKVQFYIEPPAYLPSNYNSDLVNHSSFVLTMGQIESIVPLTSIFPLDKPKYGFFDFYISELNKIFGS